MVQVLSYKRKPYSWLALKTSTLRHLVTMAPHPVRRLLIENNHGKVLDPAATRCIVSQRTQDARHTLGKDPIAFVSLKAVCTQAGSSSCENLETYRAGVWLNQAMQSIDTNNCSATCDTVGTSSSVCLATLQYVVLNSVPLTYLCSV